MAVTQLLFSIVVANGLSIHRDTEIMMNRGASVPTGPLKEYTAQDYCVSHGNFFCIKTLSFLCVHAGICITKVDSTVKLSSKISSVGGWCPYFPHNTMWCPPPF